MHDVTTHWVKELNTIFIKAITDDAEILKVPFSMNRVAGSFTGEALYKKVIIEISGIKALKDNPFNNIETAILPQGNIETGPEKEYWRLNNDLKVYIKYILVIGIEGFLEVYLLYKIRHLDYLYYLSLKIF